MTTNQAALDLLSELEATEAEYKAERVLLDEAIADGDKHKTETYYQSCVSLVQRCEELISGYSG